MKKEEKIELLKKLQKNKCFYCENPIKKVWIEMFEYGEKTFAGYVDNVQNDRGSSSGILLEHFITGSKGGKNTIDNLVVACVRCNEKKHSLDPQEFFKRIEKPFKLPPLCSTSQ